MKKRKYLIAVIPICVLCMIVIICLIYSKISFYTETNVAIKNNASSQDLWEKAIYYIERRQYYHAIKLYQRIIQDYPRHKNAKGAQHTIGACYEWAGDYKKAKEAYKAFMKKYPDSKLTKVCKQHMVQLDNPTYRKVNEAMQIKPERLDKIIKKCQKIINNSSGQKKVDAIFKIGECYFFKGEYLKSIESFQEIINNYSDHPKVREAQKMIEICQGVIGNCKQEKE
ncbi:tetratricopeptide repeat protein [bacterium]|nr:tetratricopeptide repeat protein [bacterium]MBU1753108.1 tetratricopeptide repeat protein [bacterium]